MLTTAEDFLESGIAVIPIAKGDKRPNFRLLPEIDGHSSWEPFKTELPTKDLLAFWRSQGMLSYGVVAGWNGLAILDFDDMDEYNRWLLWTKRVGGQAEAIGRKAYRVLSGRGVHVYLRMFSQEKNRKVGKIDIKFTGYVLGPGSLHPSGKLYTAIDGIIPWVAHLSDVLPAALLTQTNIPSKSGLAPGAMPVIDPWQVSFQAPSKAGLTAKIKAALKIEDFFTELFDTGGRGRWKVACCPLHEDRHPSMWVDTEQQICGCFAGCTPKPLDVINLYARMYGLSNTAAIQTLAQKLT